MTDERPESLAAQAASWVPPWERTPRPPDPEFAAKTRAEESDDGELAEPNLADGDGELAEPNLADGDGELAETSLADGDEVDPAVEGPDPAVGAVVSIELPPFPEEAGGPPTVDAPREIPGEAEREPTDVGAGPELPQPDAIEQAAEHEIGSAPLVDAPLDGDDAGDVFDAAADDDIGEDAELDLPFAEEVPGPDEDEEPTTARAEASAPVTEQAGTASPGAGQPSPEEVVGSGSTSADSGTPPAGDPTAASSASRTDNPSPSAGAEAAPADAAAVDAAARGSADVEAAVGAGAVARQPVSRARPSSGIPAQGRGSKGGAAASGALSTRTEEEAQAPAPMDDAELRAALEAILLVVDEPVAEMQLAQIVEQPAERVGGMLEDISARYTAAGHGFDLRRAAGGWRLYTRPEYAAYVERFVLDGQSVRLTQAALETLAVVAYKQPVTRSRISAIRGVNCDGVMRTLNTRGLIEECGIEGETGAFLYRTTALFLEKLGLNSVDQLPPLAPFLPDDVEEVLDASG
jgi:segregation and condensation protein B